MKKTRLIMLLCALFLLLITAACSSDREEDDPGSGTDEQTISIVRIEAFKKLEISDWMDSDTVVVSKENESLEKMKLEELSDSYPKSLYLYHLDNGEYELLKEEQDLHLGGAKLSSDKKNLLYHGISLGDFSYYVLNLESRKSFGISGEPIGSAGSAAWADQDTVIGAGYTNGAYYAGTDGRITALEELNRKNIFLIGKMEEIIYYNTTDDSTLMALDLSAGEITDLDLSGALGVYPAPDESKMLVLQYDGVKQVLMLCDKDGSKLKTIAEGSELGGVSWSPDQRMVAYCMKEDGSGTAAGGLYVYDMLTGKSTLIAADIWAVATCWSPSGQELAYTQWNGKRYDSSIVYLEYSIQKTP